MTDFFSTTHGLITLGALLGAGGFALGSASRSIDKLAGFLRPSRSRQDARGLAMLTVLALDDYVGSCYAAVHDLPEFNPADAEEFAFHLPEPVLALPANLDGRLLGTELAEDLMWFSNRVSNLENALESLDLSRNDHEGFFERRMEGYALIAARAMDLIARICDQFDLSLPDKPDYYRQAEGLSKILRNVESLTKRRSTAPAAGEAGTNNVTPLFPKTS
ncbi:MAG: hypothetical protein ACK4QP_00285 [Pseudorhizobium sp.]